MINKGIVLGHLGADPEVRRTQAGTPVVSFSLATSERWKDKATGEKRERTEWHRIVIFNEALCKVAEEFLKKGSRVYIEGTLRTRSWTDKDKVERWTTEIVLGPFHAALVLCDRAGNGNRPPAADETSYGAMPGSAPAASPLGDLNDEIPF